MYPEKLQTPIELKPVIEAIDYGLELVHDMTGQPRNYIHEIGITEANRATFESLKNGYRQVLGWIANNDQQMWLYRSEWPLYVATWIES